MTVQKMIRSFGCHLNLASSLVNLWFFLISPKILQVHKTPLLCWFSICYHQQNTPSPSRKKTQFDNQKHHLESPTKTPSISWKASHFLSNYHCGFKWHPLDKKNNCQSDGALTKHDVRICKVSYTSPAKTYHTPPKLKRFWCMSTSMPSIFKEAKLLRLQVNSKPFFLSRKRACCVGLASNEVLGGCLFHWGRFIDVWSKTFQRKVLLLPYRGGRSNLIFSVGMF